MTAHDTKEIDYGNLPEWVADIVAIGESQRLHQCVECARVFNMANANDADEWHYGHDCESA